jgi:hypothetical protein
MIHIHPLLRLVATQPHLLADHAEAYAGLVGEEVGKAATVWKRRAALNAIALCAGGVSVVLIGVAVMMWAASADTATMRAGWVLIATPAVPALIALLCFIKGKSDDTDAFVDLKQQVAADLSMLREVSVA